VRGRTGVSPVMSRIAREIQLIRTLDDVGKANYREAMSEGMAKYSGRYGDVNDKMLDALGVNIVKDLIQYPSQLKIVENTPTLHGLAWDKNIWTRDDLPYPEKILNHELAHIGFNHSGRNTSTALSEVQAEGTSYGIGHRLGIPTDILAMNAAPVLHSRMKQYSPEQIGNMIEMNRVPISGMVGKFMSGM
jgi:hypothetical protein